MSPDPSPLLADLARLLQAEPELVGGCRADAELRHDAVTRTRRRHHEGLGICQGLAQPAWAQARPAGAIPRAASRCTPPLA